METGFAFSIGSLFSLPELHFEFSQAVSYIDCTHSSDTRHYVIGPIMQPLTPVESLVHYQKVTANALRRTTDVINNPAYTQFLETVV